MEQIVGKQLEHVTPLLPSEIRYWYETIKPLYTSKPEMFCSKINPCDGIHVKLSIVLESNDLTISDNIFSSTPLKSFYLFLI